MEHVLPYQRISQPLSPVLKSLFYLYWVEWFLCVASATTEHFELRKDLVSASRW